MRRKQMRGMIIAMLALVLALMPYSFGGAESLKGIKEFRVVVEPVSTDARDIGLTDDRIKNDVELRLRLAGLPVVDKDPQRWIPYLYVNVPILTMNDPDEAVYFINSNFVQAVYLDNESYTRTTASTWFNGALGTSPQDDAREDIRSVIRDKVDEFINDYLSVNPK